MKSSLSIVVAFLGCVGGRANAFLPASGALLSRKQQRRLLVSRRSATEESHPGPVIQDWAKLRVPFLNVKPGHLPLPYGLNLEVREVDGTLESTPRPKVVTSLVWDFGGSHPHPELRPDFPVGQWLSQRPNLGIALSGGGMRAASTCLGWLRGLNELGLLSKARYISSNSGATWVTLPLAVKQLLMKKEHKTDLDYEEFLGKYVEPDAITGSESELGFIGKILRDSDILRERDGTTRRYGDGSLADFTSWVTAIDENFVQPMSVGPKPDLLLDMGNAYLWNDGEKRLDDKTFPFPIFVATAYPDVEKPDVAVPFEFSPLYFGIPVDPRVLGDPTLNCSGGYTQSVAFNSDVRNLPGRPAPAKGAEPLQLYQLALPVKVVKAAELAGISSSFFAAAQVETGLNLEAFLRLVPFLPDFLKRFPNAESYKYWSPASGGDSVQLQFADGGIFDNTGVLGLLRRGCRTIIACVSADSAVVTDDPDSRFSDIAALFGRAKDPFTSVGSANMMQVFDPDKWDGVLGQLRDCYAAGKPQVCKAQLEVRPNARAGIYDGGRTVEVYFCVNGRSTEWWSKLGKGAERLKRATDPGWWPFVGPESLLSVVPGAFSPTKINDRFPYYSTFRVIYDRDVVNMMAHNCAYAIKTGLEGLGFDARGPSPFL